MTLHVRDRLRTLPRRDPVVTRADASLRAVAHTLWSESVGVAVVGNVHHARGVVSVRDLLRPLLLDALSGPVSDTSPEGSEQ